MSRIGTVDLAQITAKSAKGSVYDPDPAQKGRIILKLGDDAGQVISNQGVVPAVRREQGERES